MAETFTPSPDRSLAGYLRSIRGFPMLEEAEEQALAQRWRERGDTDAAHRLVTSHLRLVPKIASGYRGYGLPFGDLISAGNIGVVQAVQRFDPDRGIRLSTYAIWWVKAAIQEYVLQSWSIVKMATTGAQKKLFFNLRRIKARLRLVGDGDLPAEEVRRIAVDLAVPESAVVSMNRRLQGPDHTLDAPLALGSDESWIDRLVDPEEDQEARLGEAEDLARRRAILGAALERLNERERRILVARRLNEPAVKLKVLAEEYGISRERVRQIEMHALAKVSAVARRGETERALVSA